MKKLFTGILASLACLACLAGCKQTNTDLEGAKAYLDAMYKQKNVEVRADYDLVEQVTYDGKTYAVTWTVNVDETVAKIVDGDGKVTVDVNEAIAEDTAYVLTATITDENGDTVSVSFNRKVLKPNKQTPDGVSMPIPGKAYKYFLYQAAKEKTLYFKGSMSGFYFATSENVRDAVDVYVEVPSLDAPDNQYYMYFELDGVKQYIGVVRAEGTDGNMHNNIVFSSTEKYVFSYNSTYNVMTTIVKVDGVNTEFYIGTYGDYSTFSASTIDHITEETSYPAYLAEVEVPEEVPSTSTLLTVTAPEAGVEYYYAGVDGSTVYYFSGYNVGSDDFYAQVTTDEAAAAKVKLVAVDGQANQYYVSYVKDNTTYYLNAYNSSGTYINMTAVTDKSQAVAYTYNTEYNVLTVDLIGDTYYLGYFNDSWRASKISYISTSIVGRFMVSVANTEITNDMKLAEEKLSLNAKVSFTDVTTATKEFTVPTTGYKFSDVTYEWASDKACAVVAGNKITVTQGTAAEMVTLTVTVKVNGTAVGTQNFTFNVAAPAPSAGTLAATFDFGANDTSIHNTQYNAVHFDGAELTSDTPYTSGSYTMTLTSLTKVYGGAYDEKGNSCLKLGTGSKTASLSFTVGADVTKVIIYVAGYKNNTVTVTANGTATDITTKSNAGEYTAITVDTSTNKTVTFATTTGYRAMINTIEFYKA